MGKCYNCETEVTLIDEEVRCDKCNAKIQYRCHNCKNLFLVANDKGDKLAECKACGFFYCPNCGCCGPSCDKKEWVTKIRKILKPEITHETTENLSEKLQELVEYIEEIKVGKERRTCPANVPISYAKSRIKSLLVRMEGHNVRSPRDQIKFEQRINELTEKPMGTVMTINQERDEGTYGQEYRDAFNLSVCLGVLEAKKKKLVLDKGAVEYMEYIRINSEPCSYLSKDNLILKRCKGCKKKSPLSQIQCCVRKKNTKEGKKGEPFKLTLSISNVDICKLDRGLFIKKDG